MTPTAVAGPAAARVDVVGDGAVADAVARSLPTCSEVDGAAPAVVVVPRVPEAAALSGFSDRHLDAEVAEPLTDVLLAVQQALPALRASGAGRLVFVLPVGPVMGEPSAGAAAAVAGGVLSMARTLALELGRDGVTVNVVVVDARRLDDLGPALAGELAALLGRGGAGLTGQEIYVTGGAELGRLRP
jgi:NAD(P)-dependent dehydrogenase (short-subunit alcohol dehydrogenase family)